MIWIEAIMAFAVTMMAFSTIVSMIVEMLNRMLRLREDKLKMMLNLLYEEVVIPQVNAFSGKSAKPDKKFADKMTTPDFEPGKTDTGILQRLLHLFLNPKNAKNMSIYEFVEKLARTKEGQVLYQKGLQKGEEHLKAYLEDLVSRYRNFEESAREYFTRRARFASVLVAIVLAFGCNINPFLIFTTYLNNSNLRNNIISQGEVIGEQMEGQQAKLEELLKGEPIANADVEDIKKSYEDIKDSLGILQKAEVPFGWSAYGLQSDKSTKENPIAWFFSVLLGGLLIGLGGPFWFDFFKKMSVFAGSVRSLPLSPGQPKDTIENNVPTEGTPDEKIDPLSIFKRAAMTEEAKNSLPRRPLLSANGNVLKGE